nr:MAG TPA: hypothetical protein [Microviridae sp.]
MFAKVCVFFNISPNRTYKIIRKCNLMQLITSISN